VVEDDPYVTRLYERIFAGSSIDIKIARDGKEGTEVARTYQPDLILLDIMMPKMNGLDALAILKTDKRTKSIPVFMLSNLGEDETVKDAMSKGADAFLIKSDYTPEQIRDKVEVRLLNRN